MFAPRKYRRRRRSGSFAGGGCSFGTDAETGESVWVDTSDKKVRDEFEAYGIERDKELDRIFKHAGVDMASISADEDYVRALITLFKKRGAGY